MTRQRMFAALFFMFAACFTPSESLAWEWLDNTVSTVSAEMEPGSVIGMGVYISDNTYRGMDNNVYPVPIIDAEYKQFFIDKNVVGYDFMPGEELRLALVGAPHLGGYHSSDSSFLSGMEDRDWSIDAGAQVEWDNGMFIATAALLQDILDNSGGLSANAWLSKEFFHNALKPRIGVEWFSEDVTDYYYGVRTSEAAFGRPAYAGDDTINFLVGMRMALPLGEKWALVADVQYTMLGNEIEDSPIVETGNLMRYIAGLVYRF